MSLWLAALAALAGAASAAQEPTLEPGRSVERELGPGESHAYQIVCPAGTFVHSVVEQRGADVVIAVSGPDGAEMLLVDTPTGPTGREGAETVPFVAEHAGGYRLVVRGLDRETRGAYTLRLDELRPAMARDRTLFEGRRLWAEGRRLRAQGSADALRNALAAHERAGQLLQEAGADGDAANVLKQAGDLAGYLGELAKSVDDYDRALALASRVGSGRIQGLAHLGLGARYRALGQAEPARDHLNQALDAFRSLKDDRGIGMALMGLAAAQYEDFGDASEALRLLDQVLDLSRSLADARLERSTLHSIASIHDWRGAKQRALEYYKPALELLRAAGDRTTMGVTLNEMGRLYAEWGDYARARDAHAEALDLARQVGNRQQEASTLVFIGRMHHLQGDMEKALANLSAALALSREIGDTALQAGALSRLGEAYGNQGDTARALEHLRAAVELYRGLNVPYWPALTRLHLARACLRAGDTEQAQAVLAEARQAAGQYETAGIEAAARRELARVALRRGDPRAALGHAEAAVATVESERAKIDQEDFKTTYFASVHEYYQTYIDALMARHRQEPSGGYAGRALHVSERARGRRVLEALQESAMDLRSAADPALVEHEQALRQELSALASQQARLVERGAPAAQRTATERKLRELEGQRQEALTRLRQSSPAYAALVHPPILEAQQVQDQLEPDTALLEYALGEDRSFLWVVTRGSIVARELAGGAAIEDLARGLYQALAVRSESAPSAAERQRRVTRADRRASEAAAALSRLILPDDLGALGVKRLVIVADGSLQMVPFAVLPLPAAAAAGSAAPLASRFEIAYAPSASWVATLRRLREGVPPPRKALAVLADPVFDRADSRVRGADQAASPSDARLRLAVDEVGLRGGRGGGLLPRLPFSRREALAAASLFAKSDVLIALDFDASRERALSPELAQYRIVHFASHSLLNGEHPGLSGVVLSLVDRRGEARDGFLRLQDVYNLRLPAELVVLSACQTAMGKAVQGEGLLGLARGFMYAGAERVVASLWPVDEVATTELMTAFYRNLLERKHTPSEALRRAQLALASKPRWRAAYYWAGFVVEGEWR